MKLGTKEKVKRCVQTLRYTLPTYMTKSMPPSCLTQRSTAPFRLPKFRTSIAPIPMTMEPGRAIAISLATNSVFSIFRPTIHASAPRRTKARTWALQTEPAPPVQKTTLFSMKSATR